MKNSDELNSKIADLEKDLEQVKLELEVTQRKKFVDEVMKTIKGMPNPEWQTKLTPIFAGMAASNDPGHYSLMKASWKAVMDRYEKVQDLEREMRAAYEGVDGIVKILESQNLTNKNNSFN